MAFDFDFFRLMGQTTFDGKGDSVRELADKVEWYRA